MEEQKQEQKRECRHFLWLTLRPGKRDITLWAYCQRCRRSWFLGDHAEVMAGLSRLEGADVF